MDFNLERAWLLIQISMYSQAEEELRLKLAIDPHNCLAHLLLCQCSIEQDKYQEAIREAELLICLAPGYAHAFYAKAFVIYNFYLKKPSKISPKILLEKSEKAARKAVQLNPASVDYWTLLAVILFEKGHEMGAIMSRPVRELIRGEKSDRACWLESLDALEQALYLEPESIECIHLKALILNKLDRKEQAKLTLFKQTLSLSLFERQQHPGTHTYLGWFLLDENNHKQALEHFIFAFKLASEPEKARLGIVEALKRKYLFYRLLSPTVKMGRKIWFFAIGLFFVGAIANVFDRGKFLFSNWSLSLLLGYILFILALPLLFNLILKLKNYERKFLSTHELVISHFLAGIIFVILTTITMVNIYPSEVRSASLFLTLVSSSLLIPFSVTRAYCFGQQKSRLLKYTLILSIFAAIGLTLFANLQYIPGVIGIVATLICFICCGFSTVGSFLSYHVATNLIDRLFKREQTTTNITN